MLAAAGTPVEGAGEMLAEMWSVLLLAGLLSGKIFSGDKSAPRAIGCGITAILCVLLADDDCPAWFQRELKRLSTQP